MTPKTVNQALDKLFTEFTSEEVKANSELSELKTYLQELKMDRGGNAFLPTPISTCAIFERAQQKPAA